MEFFAFLGLAFVGVVFFIWRSRRRTSTGPDTLTRGLPDDLRDKNDGMSSLPGGPSDGGGGGVAGW
jgi:hypothetical protein